MRRRRAFYGAHTRHVTVNSLFTHAMKPPRLILSPRNEGNPYTRHACLSCTVRKICSHRR